CAVWFWRSRRVWRVRQVARRYYGRAAREGQRGMTNPKKGRPRKGSLVYTQSGYRARITVEVDGVPVQKRFDLGTKDRAAAKAKLRALVRKHAPAEPEATKKPLTVQEYGQGWVERREQMGIAAASYERRYLERVWYPAIGKLALRDVGKAELQ